MVLCAGLRLDVSVEAERIKRRLNSLSEGAAGVAHPFWSDRNRGSVLVTLQDRVGQASTFVELCHSMLEKIHRALFPLNDTPSGLRALLRDFRFGRAMKSFIREQCVGGAVVALAFC